MSTKTALPEGQLYIPNGRLSFPKLYEPKAAKGDPNSKPRYGCKILIPKSDEATKAAIDKEIARLTKLHLKGVKPKTSMLPIQDGDGEEGDEYSKDHWVLSANRAQSQGPPQVVDRTNKAIDSKQASTVYGGCYCDFVVGFFFQANWGRVCCGLEIVRKKRDGESFGAARVDANDVLPELPEDEEDDDAGFGV